ncbi:MAG: CpsD/CapB family tyrosine-protein kinase [Pseudomonadota bacterium]
MERIKQALEKAEAERQHSGAAESIVETLASAPRSIPAAPSQPVSSDFRFEVTRTVSVDSKHLERHRIVSSLSDDAAAQSYGLLASRVVDQAIVNGWNSIAVVSPLDGDGKSVTTLNLAFRLADSPKRTCLVVDLDFRRPRIAEYLGVAPESGVEDVLLGRAEMSDALFSPDTLRLSILPVREPSEHSAGMIDSLAAAQLAQEVKTRYANRLVLFDLPPVLGAGDTVNFLRNVDAVLLVASSGKTSEAALKETVNALAGNRLMGCVLNGAEDVITAY